MRHPLGRLQKYFMVKTIQYLIVILLLISQNACKRNSNSNATLSEKGLSFHSKSDSIINTWFAQGGKNKDSLMQILYEAGQVDKDRYYYQVSRQRKSEIKTKLYGPDWIYSSSEIPLNKNDFNIGALSLDVSFDSLKEQLGKPDSARIYERWSYATAYYFPQFVVWVYNENQHIASLDVYNHKYFTNRGLRVGDSLSSVLKLYPRETDYGTATFDRIGPFDDTFKDYSEYRVYDLSLGEDDGWLLVIFTKNSLVRKMLFYIGEGC